MGTLNAKIQTKISGNFIDALDVGEVDYDFLTNIVKSFANGTGADQANQIFTDERTLSASNNEDLDLAGSLTDAFGTTITFTKVKAIIVIAAAGNTNNVQVARPASNGVPLFLAASDGLAIKPGGSFMLVDPSAGGVTVTASTGDLINIANSGAGTSVTYKIIIIGTV